MHRGLISNKASAVRGRGCVQCTAVCARPVHLAAQQSSTLQIMQTELGEEHDEVMDLGKL